MKKFIISGTLVIIILTVCIVVISNFYLNQIEKDVNDCKTFLGKEVIINKDTLIITDFSVFESTFILSDGRSVNKELIKKLLDERSIKY